VTMIFINCFMEYHRGFDMRYDFFIGYYNIIGIINRTQKNNTWGVLVCMNMR
jgi:hypothetical protein